MRVTTTARFVVWTLLGVAAAHGGEHHESSESEEPHNVAHNEHNSTSGSMAGMPMGHEHGRPILEDPDLSSEERKFWEAYDPTTFYTAEEGSKPLLYLHAATALGSFGFFYPVSLMTSYVPRGQWLYIPFQTFVSALGAAAVLLWFFYSATAPSDLYPGSIYGGYGLVLLILVGVHWVAMISRAAAGIGGPSPIDGAEYVLAKLGRNSLDSGQDSGRDTSDEASDEFNIDDETDSAVEGERADVEAQFHDVMHYARPPLLVRSFAGSTWGSQVVEVFGSAANIVYQVLNVPLFFAGVGYVLLGIATTFRMGQGHMVFGLTAHFIKGTVFFLLGLFELARYFGSLSKNGMAWNFIELGEDGRPLRGKNLRHGPIAMPPTASGWRSRLRFWPDNASMEYWQCALITFYGITNVFLEHLGNEDGVWNHKDIQHASIAFMFLGGGLCGLALESQTLRRLMAAGFGYEYQRPTVMGPSVNPMPAMVIFWTGALMSQHHQESELATSIHVQWGLLLSCAAVFRGFTYALIFLRPATDERPQRPFTEVLCSFFLVCGGLIFVLSNRETVQAMQYRGIDGMFTLVVGVGITALVLSYAIIGFAVKGLAAARS